VLVAFDLPDPFFYPRIGYYDYWYVPAVIGNGLSSLWPFEQDEYEADLAAHASVPSPLRISLTENGIGDFTATVYAEADVSNAAFVMAAVLPEEVPAYQGSLSYLPYHAKLFMTGYLGDPFSIAAGESAAIRKVFAPDPAWTYSDMGVVSWVQIDGGTNPSPSPDVPVKHEVLQAAYVAAGATGVSDPALSRRVALSAPRPNPFRGAARLAFSTLDRAAVVVTVHDVAGRGVAVLLDGVVEAGDHDVVWDGRGGTGRPVSSGIYFVRLSSDGAQPVTRKVVLVR
jgi:hypothetical protein